MRLMENLNLRTFLLFPGKRSAGFVACVAPNGILRLKVDVYAEVVAPSVLVMGFAQEGHAWVTLQTHKNVIAIASLKELACVILVKGNKPDDDMLEQAKEEDIPVLGTTEQTFEVAGQIYSYLNA